MYVYKRTHLTALDENRKAQLQHAFVLNPFAALVAIWQLGILPRSVEVSVESNTQNYLNSRTDLEPPCQARSNELLGTT
jgi:hypothetical protein